MKQVFVCCVMICSLLFAVCGCSNDLSPQQGTGQKESGIKQNETDNNNSQTSGEQGQNEPDPQEVKPQEISLLEISELRTEYSSEAKRAEYIEFKVKSAGNLNGLRLYIMWNAKTPFIYDFPAVDVSSGEYVTLHLRTLESNCINELGKNLSESAGTDSCPTARDLWIPGSTELLRQTDIVYLQDADGKIFDAIIMNESPGDTWKKNQAHFAGIAEDLYARGVWKSANGKKPSPLDAVDTSTTSPTKSVSRYEGKENTHTAKDWYITALNKASPGQPNK